MDNLQVAMEKNSGLERELGKVRSELAGKEQFYQQRIADLGHQITSMQGIIDAKIEENLSLTANNLYASPRIFPDLTPSLPPPSSLLQNLA